jgi:cyclase
MLKKRIIGVVIVLNGWAVQSFGYQKYLPLGRPEYLVENLDRWGADEILVLSIDRSVQGLGPDFMLLDRLARMGIGTPLIYGGGIRNLKDGLGVIHRGADRIVIDSLLHDNLHEVKELGSRLGVQALIASLPLSIGSEGYLLLDHRTSIEYSLPEQMCQLVKLGLTSEILITDWRNEGRENGFDLTLVEHFPCADTAIIAFGGITNSILMQKLLVNNKIAAIAVGNFLNYKEHAVQSYKSTLASTSLRLPCYSVNYPAI